MQHPSGSALPQAIQLLHMAIAEHPDPAAKQTLSTCLANMLKVQMMDMQQSQSQQQPQRAIVRQLAG